MRVTPSLFSQILLEVMSQGPLILTWRGLHKGMNIRRWRPWGASSESVCHRHTYKMIGKSFMKGLFTRRGMGKIKRSQQEILRHPRAGNSREPLLFLGSVGGLGAGKYVLQLSLKLGKMT